MQLVRRAISVDGSGDGLRLTPCDNGCAVWMLCFRGKSKHEATSTYEATSTRQQARGNKHVVVSLSGSKSSATSKPAQKIFLLLDDVTIRLWIASFFSTSLMDRLIALFISSDKEFAGGRFITSVATPAVSSVVVRTSPASSDEKHRATLNNNGDTGRPQLLRREESMTAGAEVEFPWSVLVVYENRHHPKDSPQPLASAILWYSAEMMNRLLFVFLLAAAGPTVDAFAAHPFRMREGSPLAATFTKSSGRPRAEVSATTCNKQHFEPDISNIITESGAKRRLKASTLSALGLLAVASRSTVANAARKTASAAVVPPILELPSTKTLALACLVPTLLGFYKSGMSSARF
ncbi:hypothetical protein THAOC_06449 [Thalassiosira oceanica]|uniref:Uncharacterized protein n=1 Tax=Thalassiosira oceanica TaxID=159749 RepID=K0T2U1_THAOC|nr:hypothetical protein THAOC_06449 [Thalassiosira oceanica]|eukprot:EJK72060.1 hypothetical protein THAOC_06449 [Thalassiosira oceanica]